jgi:hypothetical protein
MMSQLLTLSGIQVTPNPAAIFEWMARETPEYAGMNYATLDKLGVETAKEMVR